MVLPCVVEVCGLLVGRNGFSIGNIWDLWVMSRPLSRHQVTQETVAVFPSLIEARLREWWTRVAGY